MLNDIEFCLLINSDSLNCMTGKSDKTKVISAVIAAVIIFCGLVEQCVALEEEQPRKKC